MQTGRLIPSDPVNPTAEQAVTPQPERASSSTPATEQNDTAKAYRGQSTRSAGETQRIARAAKKNKGASPATSTDPQRAIAASTPAPTSIPAATRSTDVPPSQAGLLKACISKGVSPADAAVLMKYVATNGVDVTAVIHTMMNARGNAFEAAKAYAITEHATRSCLTSSNSERLESALTALRDGRVSVTTGECPDSYATYNPMSNVLTTKTPGLDLNDVWSRSTLVHECAHVAQDSAALTQNRFDAEHEGHDVAADYFLHATGAITETPDGPHLNLAASEVPTQHGEAVDRNQRVALMLDLAIANARAGKPHLNGGLEGATIDDLVTARGPDTFNESYAETLRTNHKSEAAIEDMRTPRQKDGL